jgi:hypothetical protein
VHQLPNATPIFVDMRCKVLVGCMPFTKIVDQSTPLPGSQLHLGEEGGDGDW